MDKRRWSKIKKNHLKEEFIQKKNTQIYWDDVALFYHLDQYHLGIQEMEKEAIIEIDNYDELVQIDPSYKNYEDKIGG